jgi:hydroxymethylbilane synthase
MKKSIVIGTRRSKLALIQAESVSVKLKQLYPDLQITIEKIMTHGDRDKSTILDQMDASVFVKELEIALLENKIDIAVHSLKDLPVNLSPDLCLIAVTERIDSRDVLVARINNLDTLPSGSRIGTSSIRRKIQVANYRSELKTCDIRGNIDTRVNKVVTGEIDGLITAAAAMIRLCKEDQITEYLSTKYFLPSPGQGALGIEARFGDSVINDLILPINCYSQMECCLAERQYVRSLGLGCNAPVAAFCTVDKKLLKLDAMGADVPSARIFRECEIGDIDSAEELGTRLATRMIKSGLLKSIKLG